MPDRRLSILLFSNTLARGGAEEHILTLLRGLDRTRFRPLLACTPEVAAKLGGDVPDDVPVTALRLRRPKDTGAARQLLQLLRRERIDVLHSHLFYSSLFASPLGWLARVPLVVETPHVSERWRHGLKGHYAVDRMFGRFVHRYIAVSEANRRYLIDEKRLPGSKIVVIHNGCDLRRFDPRHRVPDGLRASLGFEDSDPVLVVIGRLEPQKGHRVLLDALPLVMREFPAMRLVCVGEGALRAELEAKSAALGLANAVRFVGQQANVPDWLALADVAVLPSLYEGLPLAAIETLAAQRAMVATAVDGTPEVIVDDQTGLLVPPEDAGALAGALCRLLRDPALRASLASAGRERVAQHFSEERQVARTEALYEMGLHRQRSSLHADEPLAAGAHRP
jgi:glycosyltransferase involved in cell wall biosynthesis